MVILTMTADAVILSSLVSSQTPYSSLKEVSRGIWQIRTYCSEHICSHSTYSFVEPDDCQHYFDLPSVLTDLLPRSCTVDTSDYFVDHFIIHEFFGILELNLMFKYGPFGWTVFTSRIFVH